MLTFRDRRRIEAEEILRRKIANTPTETSAVWRVANSPFVLLFLGTLAVSVLGGIYTTEKQCSVEAAQLATQWDRLRIEIISRLRGLYAAIESMKTTTDADRVVIWRSEKSSYVFLEFKYGASNAWSMLQNLRDDQHIAEIRAQAGAERDAIERFAVRSLVTQPEYHCGVTDVLQRFVGRMVPIVTVPLTRAVPIIQE
jgi:hypothetical protein